ncbi:penicillin-binding protein 1C [Roseibium sp. RKSG952]|uniref:penicillin-binding protein 1C n=1 Tax=Roseibium sp. RKSG952 TaxID=2529384 RepID=UPI001FCC787D|nr:penicillin-binding protein 1C [Roseibium sp. RKSG952]
MAAGTVSGRLKKAAFAAGASLTVLAVGLGAGAAKLHLDVSQQAKTMTLPAPPVSQVVLDRKDRLLRAFLATDDKWRLPVALNGIDPLYFKVLTAYEDKRFSDHAGVDWRAMLRALFQSATAGRIVSGGSTLTMQTARLLAKKPTKTPGAKYRQIVEALALERLYSKEDILGLYSLRAPFGGNLEGVRAASLVWFGKEPRRLTLAEAALLVALPQSPEARRPDRFPEAAREARARVLRKAVAAGTITQDEAVAAEADRLPDIWRQMPLIAGHKTRQVIRAYPGEPVLRLTLDRDLQQGLEQLLRSRVAALGKHLSAAVIVADHRTGDILASIGSPGLLDENRAGHVDMTRAVRSPGSTLKPLIYGLAFEDGIAHPESLVEDRPVDFGGYKPTNFDRAYQGTVTVREALQMSLNTPAVQLLDAVGPARLMARLKRAGTAPRLSARKAPGLATALGGLGLTLEDLVSVYASLARLGKPVTLTLERSGASGAARRTGKPLQTPVLSGRAAWHVADILSGLPQPMAAGDQAIAYKTGTAYGYRDAWAIGFDGRFVAGVWAGRADGSPVPGLSGASAATPILFEVFNRLGPERVRLPDAPHGTLQPGRQALPGPLTRARVDRGRGEARRESLQILYPPDGADLRVGERAPDRPRPVLIKFAGGQRPYRLMVNGRPVAQEALRPRFVWQPSESGFATLTVIDARGATGSVHVILR